MSIKHRIFLLLACIAFCVNLSAQDQYVFYRMNTKDGLSSSCINSLFVDSRGYLWVSSEGGLDRYDGYSFRSYTNYGGASDEQISNVQSVVEDAEGKLWIEGTLPYAIYKGGKDGFNKDVKTYLKGLDIEVDMLYKVVADANKNLYVITPKVLYHHNFKEKKTRKWNIDIDFIQSADCNVANFDQGIYVCVGNNLYQFHKQHGRMDKVKLPESMNKSYLRLKPYVDSENTLWLFSTMSEDIVRMRSDGALLPSFTLPEAFSSQSNAIRSIIDDEMGHIWIATDREGVFVYTKSTGNIQNLKSLKDNQSTLASNNVTCMYKDNHGTVWVGHMKKGISYTNDKYRLFHNEATQCGDISTLYNDSKGNLWLGTDGNGLFKQDITGNIVKSVLPDITISCVMESRNGEIWVGTYNNGIYRINPNGSVTQMTKENGKLPTNSAWRLAEDGNGNVWMCSAFHTLVRINPNDGTIKEVKREDGSEIRGMYLLYDKKSSIYVGTFYGLWKGDIKTCKGTSIVSNNSGSQSFLHTSILSVLHDGKKNIMWLGHTTGITVWNMQNDSVYYIDNKNGLADNSIKNLLIDSNDNIWVSTGKGISCIEPIWDGSFKVLVHNYDTSDGMSESYTNQYASCNVGYGNLAIGGPDGYVLINPSQMMNMYLESPTPVVSDILVGDSIYLSDPTLMKGENGEEIIPELDFDYNNRQITIRFCTGNLVYARRVHYAYRVEGLIDEWVYTDDDHVTFYSLPSGNHTLEIKACGEDGEWGNITKVELNVSTPMWRSWWMILFYISLLLVGTYFLWKYHKSLNHDDAADEKTKLEHEQFVKIADMELRFFTNVSHDLRTPLTLIISPLQSMVNEQLPASVKNRCKMMLKNAQILMQQVNMLLDFRKLDSGTDTLRLQRDNIVNFLHTLSNSFSDYATDRNIKFNFNTKISSVYIKYDAEKVYKIMYNLLSNAFKFVPDEGEIDVNVYDDDKYVYVEVADNGPGIPDEAKDDVFKRFYQVVTDRSQSGSGIGLHIVSEYVRIHCGEITLLDNEPHGAVFKFSIPKEIDKSKVHATIVEIDDENEVTQDENDTMHESDKFTLLVVDDNTDMVNFMRDSFINDYNVITAHDGEDALDKVKHNAIDLIISDVMMPKMDGIEFCKRIKSNPNTSHIPVVLLTAKTADASVQEGLEIGADDYITKPFNLEIVRLRIQKLIENNDNKRAVNNEVVQQNNGSEEFGMTEADKELLQRAREITETHMSDPDFSVEALGAELNMSRTYLYKKLVNITGTGPGDFIRSIRLKRGARLLETGSMSISDVSSKIGYSSPKRFTENFKVEYGMSPSEYLRQFKQKKSNGDKSRQVDPSLLYEGPEI